MKLIWAPFLDPDYFKSLSLGAIWNCCKGPGLPWRGIRVWCTKGLSKGLGSFDRKGSNRITAVLYTISSFSGAVLELRWAIPLTGQQIVTLPVKFGAPSLKRLWTGHKTVYFNIQKSVNFNIIKCSLLYLQNFAFCFDFFCAGYLLV